METQIDSLVNDLLDNYRLVESHLYTIEKADTNVAKAEQMEKIKMILSQIKGIEEKLFPLRDKIKSDGGKVSDQTQSLIDQSVSIVSDLIPKLARLEEDARSERQQLAPEIHNGVRALQMQSAYNQNQ